jgi:DNA-directed RNA polymerase specialized sigma24 family protein
VRAPDLAYVFDRWAGPLLDYCDGVLPSRAAAGDAVQDTLIAAQQRVGELADPHRVRSWFYALARLRCMDGPPKGGTPGVGAREGGTPGAGPSGADTHEGGTPGAGPSGGGPSGPADDLDDFDHPGMPGADTAVLGLPDLEAEAIRQEKLQIVTAAMASLSAEDREVLNLAFRHRIHDMDLPAVLGLPLGRVRALLSGAGSRFSQAATAVAALRAGLAGCQDLETIAGGWDPRSPALAPPVRKRLARHIRSCTECTISLKGREFGPELLSVQPLAPAPAAFRLRVLAAGEDPGRAGYRRDVAASFGAFGPGGFPVVRAGRAVLRGRKGGGREGRGRARTILALSAALVILAVAITLLSVLLAAGPGQ